MGSCSSVGENEQLLLTDFSGRRTVRNGPGVMCTGCADAEKRAALILNQGEYANIASDETGARRIVRGPGAVFLGPRERLHARAQLPVLGRGQYCKVRDDRSGDIRVEQGPAVVQLGPHEVLSKPIADCPVLQDGEMCRVRDAATGDVRALYGPQVVQVAALEELVAGVEKLPVLGQADHCRVREGQSGEVRIEHGPGLVRLGAYDAVLGGVQPSPVLKKSEYCVIRNQQDGKLRTSTGPCVARLSALEEVVGGVRALPVLRQGEFVKVKNTEDGTVRIEKGPAVVHLGAYDRVLGDGARKLPVLQRGEYCRIANEEEGSVSVAHGPCVVDLGAYDEPCDSAVLKCPDLSGDEYLTVRNDADGTMRNVVGPVLFKPGPFDVFAAAQKVVNLARNEYVRIRDPDGGVRIERGERRLVPDPLDSIASGVERAVNVDEHHAVLVRNIDTGALQLVTQHGLFFPTKYQEIVRVQDKVILEPYQSVMCRDPTGCFYYASGDPSLPEGERGPGPTFFLPPHHEVVSQSWSTDLRKEHATSEEVWKFDSRPSYMNYEFNCRTLDNVELQVDVYFFWRIIDVRAMVAATADAPGDTCTHARSMILQQISKIKLMEFLERFNEIVRDACLSDPFYAERGIELLSAEVLKFECTSADTNQILREIIQETCDRLRRTERQRGENEVSLTKIEGEIAEERKRQELVEVRKSHLRVEARIEGEAEGTRIAAFLARLAGGCDGDDGAGGVGADKAFEVFELLRRLDADARLSADKRAAVEALGRGSAQLYVLPDDVNLHFGTLQNPVRPAAHGGKPAPALPLAEGRALPAIPVATGHSQPAGKPRREGAMG